MSAPVTITSSASPPVDLAINSDGSINTSFSATASVKTQGMAADGAAASGNPVQVGGVDGSGNVQALLANADGTLAVGGQFAGDAAMGAITGWTAAQVGGRASTATPSAVSADGDAVPLWLTRNGAAVVAGINNSGNAQAIATDGLGYLSLHHANGSIGDGRADAIDYVANNTLALTMMERGWGFNGTTWDRQRTAGVGNNVASTGIAAAAPYGQYLNNANQSALTTGNYGAAQVDPAGNLRTAPQRPTATDILSGYLQHTATTAAATVITVPAGRTFVGVAAVSVAASKAAAATGNGLVSALIATAGTNVVPAAGTIFAVSTRIGANAATGTAGTNGANFGEIPITVVAPAGNSVTVTLASTLTSITEGAVDCSIFGVLQ